jgi:alpha(1,3/1,4) fucosyltransferase
LVLHSRIILDSVINHEQNTMSEISRVILNIDPPTHHFLRNRLFVANNSYLNGDDMHAPYACLRDYLQSRGVEVRTADYLRSEERGVRNIYVSMGMLSNYRKLAWREDTVLSAFFAMECPIVEPSLYRALRQVQRHFKRVFTWSDSPSLERFVGEPLRCEPFCWPQSFESIHEEIWSRSDRKFLVMINANKLPRLYWQELYTERLRALEFFSRTREIDLYGKGWDEPPYRTGKTYLPYTFRRIQRAMSSKWQRFRPDPLLQAARSAYRGPAKSKAETLGQYTFALCFENSILKGWITEKLFDCFLAGTVPIYWGAPDIENYVPEECFIDFRRFEGFEDLRGFLKSLRQSEIQAYRENGREYLNSPKFRPFTKQSFNEIFCRIIEEDAGIQIRQPDLERSAC